jgi:hypothetical protein
MPHYRNQFIIQSHLVKTFPLIPFDKLPTSGRATLRLQGERVSQPLVVILSNRSGEYINNQDL